MLEVTQWQVSVLQMVVDAMCRDVLNSKVQNKELSIVTRVLVSVNKPITLQRRPDGKAQTLTT